MNQRVLVFSVDAMVYEDLQHLRSCRNTKKYFQNACGVRHIRSIYPTVTYPAHTTILPKHTANSIGNQAFDVTMQVPLSYGPTRCAPP